MGRVRAGLAVAIVALALAARVPEAAGAPGVPVLTGVMTVSAARSSWLRVQLTRPVTVTPEYRTNHLTASPDFVVSGSSGPAAIVLVGEQRWGTAVPPMLAAIALPASIGGGVGMHAEGFDPAGGVDISETGKVPAGFYRMYVITEAPATIRFRLPGLLGPHRGLVARNPLRTAIRAATGAEFDVQPATYTEGLGFDVEKRGVAVVFHWLAADALAALDSVICLSSFNPVTPGQLLPTCPLAAGGHATTAVPQTNAMYLNHRAFWEVVPGRHVAGVSTHAAGVIRRIGAVIVWFDVD